MENKIQKDDLIRINELIQVLQTIASGNFAVKAEVSAKADIIDGLATGINMMIEELAESMVRIEYVNDRIKNVISVIHKVAEGDYSVSCKTTKNNDVFDALGLGINMMIDDINGNIQEIEKEKEKLAVTLRSIGDAVIATDTEGKISMLNKVAELLTGWTLKEAIGKPVNEIFKIINEQTRELCENPVEKVIKSGEIVNLENHTILIAKDNTEKIIADSGAPIRDRNSKIIGAVLVFRDITEKSKTNQELQKSQKLESLGMLAGGIAHDFNNILTAIIGNVSIAKITLKPEDDIYDLLTEVEKASQQAKNLTQQLLAFSKGGIPVTKAMFIQDLIKESVQFTLRGSNVKHEFSISDDLLPVEIDEGQINQVISNIILNAAQSMPEGGKIEIRAKNAIIDEKYSLPILAKNGKYLEISIKDHGIGIPEKHFPKIFDPYFTTKQKGNGLGLAIAHTIIKNHNGHIYFESKIGIGTTFYIYLPACINKEISIVKDSGSEEIIAGKGRILLMDDDDIILQVGSTMLSRLGYEVELAKDGAAAIELYKKAKKEGRRFDAVIMDLTVPGGMGGKETIKKLSELDPKVKAIVSSGYSQDPIMAEYKKYGFKGVIAKPYKINEFSKVLNDVMQSK